MTRVPRLPEQALPDEVRVSRRGARPGRAGAVVVTMTVVAAACGGTLEGEYRATREVSAEAALRDDVVSDFRGGGEAERASAGPSGPVRSDSPSGQRGGGSATPTGGGLTESGGTNIGVTDDLILYGNTTVLSGPAAEYGKQGLFAVDARVQHVNDAGGINGRKLKLVFYNDEFDAAKGLAFFRRLVEGDQVFASTGSSSVDAVADYICHEVPQKQGAPLPMVGDWGLSPKSYMADRYPCIFPTAPSRQQAAWIQAQAVADLGAKSIAVVYTNSDQLGDIDLITRQQREAYEANGLEVAAMEPMDAGASSCSTQIGNVRQSGADYIYLNLVPPNDLILCVQAMQSQVPAYRPRVGTEFITPLQLFIDTGGEFVEGFYVQSIFKPRDDPNPAMREYMEDMTRYHPDVDPNSDITIAYYLSMKVNEHLLSGLGRHVTRERLMEAANNLRNWDSGLGPVISWSPADHGGSRRAYRLRVEDGQFVHTGEVYESNCPRDVCG